MIKHPAAARIAHLVGLPARRKKADASRKNAESPPRRKVAKPRYVRSDGSGEEWDGGRLKPAPSFALPTWDAPADDDDDQAAIAHSWDLAMAKASGRHDPRRKAKGK